MFIYLARHAWAGDFGDPQWPDDSLRELTPEGAERYAQMVETLAGRGFAPRRIATSPYARCLQTAEIISRCTEHSPPVEVHDALAPGGGYAGLLEWSAACGGEDVCWVGHNPDMELVASALVGGRGAGVRFAKGAIAAIRFDTPPGGGEPSTAGRLYWHVTAKSLGL
ncbi:phosphohistidine phosphatase [Posidoniimonas polymericola]|uniref:Phosphohistidine phosphatase n=1 Tax=Posidoniimonas polymericola TaxID=2528002 RepID=A0A5C5YU40_9BACT|nr:histidine phosphatase family protein [Posidoniimonas polymericola]TWT78276.1 phosphohistidine phosphatase [Posidoniimonas polymericola]